MQQLSRTCQVAGHSFKAIEYACVYPQCQLSRFLCSKCLLDLIHKHSQSDNSHILDNRDFYEQIKNNLIQAKGNLQYQKYDIEKSFIVPLKQILYEIQNNDLYEMIKNDLRQAKGKLIQKKYDIERFFIVPLKEILQKIQNLLKNFQNIVQQVGQDKLQNININHLENQLLNVQKYGFNQIDDQSLNNLINISKYQQDLNNYKQLEDQANLIIQNAQKIKEWRLQQIENKQSLSQSQSQKIKDVIYEIQQIDDTANQIYTGAISNDLKYIVSGGYDKLLKIWDYQSNKLIKSMELDNFQVCSCKFTEDSTLLYAGSYQYLYQFDVQNQFKELDKQEIHDHLITSIYCITNTIILTSSCDKTIIKTDVDKKQQLLKIQAHDDAIYGLDYNKSLNIIVSGSNDKSIKLWNGNDGSLIIEKLNALDNDQEIRQVLFIINNNQLISLGIGSIIIWNINYETKQLEQLQQIEDSGENISLVLQQQYIIATGEKFIKVYSIKGEFVRQFDHEIKYCLYFNTVQLDSMKAVLILGRCKLQVCKLNID